MGNGNEVPTITKGEARELAIAYNGFMRASDSRRNAEIISAGHRLEFAQERAGVEMVQAGVIKGILIGAGERAENGHDHL